MIFLIPEDAILGYCPDLCKTLVAAAGAKFEICVRLAAIAGVAVLRLEAGLAKHLVAKPRLGRRLMQLAGLEDAVAVERREMAAGLMAAEVMYILGQNVYNLGTHRSR